MSGVADSQGFYVPVIWRERGLCSRISACVRAMRLHASRGKECVCVRDQSVSRDGVLGMGLLTCGMCIQKSHRSGSGSGCALDSEAGHGEGWRGSPERAPASCVGGGLACV